MINAADLRGIEQDAPQHVATVWVDNDGCNDFELSPFFSLPAGEHKLYTHAAALQAAPPAPACAAVPEDDDEDGLPAGFAHWYNNRFARRGVDTQRMGDCEESWRAALAAAPAQAVAVPAEVDLPDVEAWRTAQCRRP